MVKENNYFNVVSSHIRYLIDFKVMDLAAKKLSFSNIYCINHRLGLRREQQLEMGDETAGATLHHLTEILSILPIQNTRYIHKKGMLL